MSDAIKQQRDKFTISFRAAELKAPINQLLDSWEDKGFKLSSKAALALLKVNQLENCSHFDYIAQTYEYIYKSLASVYGSGTPELYQAVNEVMIEAVIVDSKALTKSLNQKRLEGLHPSDDKILSTLKRPVTEQVKVMVNNYDLEEIEVEENEENEVVEAVEVVKTPTNNSFGNSYTNNQYVQEDDDSSNDDDDFLDNVLTSTHLF